MSAIISYCAATAVIVTAINAALVALFVRIRKAQDEAFWEKQSSQPASEQKIYRFHRPDGGRNRD
ncbi:hypothetical protein GOB93_11810 [Acetobacter musti]|uniref:Uncharacterized protein n=1 Tax=Acetobacter musti TaxID=864732 RepID=A0ABX0JPD7_9PROT|nr:hypothetical protein [Acetobacter musti]NHN85321.1 hypothetical protein [Acetobacter musti]